MIDDAASKFGRLDILVNNAGTIRRDPVLDLSKADWDDVVQVNLKSVFFPSQAAARVMAKNGAGKIINIASMLSFQGGINVISYAAAKSGMAGITRGLANEWAKHNINGNAIAPGYMATDNTTPLHADRIAPYPFLNESPRVVGVHLMISKARSSSLHLLQPII